MLKNYIEHEITKSNSCGPITTMIETLNVFARLTTGIYGPAIYFKKLGSHAGESSYLEDKKELYLYYDVKGGGEYQYNKIIIKDYKIIKSEDNGCNEVRKLYNIVYASSSEQISTLKEYLECIRYVHQSESKYSNKKKKFIAQLLELHNSILFKYNYIGIFKSLYQLNYCWVALANKRAEDETLPEIPKLPEHKPRLLNEIIVYPDDSRGSLCSNFLVAENYNQISNLNKGDKIKLLNTRKGSREKEYIYLETGTNDFIALRNIETSEIEFLTDLYTVECAYDALFSCNKITYRGWYNKRVTFLK